MKDFAAAAMLRLVRLGLQRHGLASADSSSSAGEGALVPLQVKRQLLASLMWRHGPALLLRLGEAVHDADDEPTLMALTEARTATDLIARWQRLERFVHSRHRVVTLAASDTGCTLRHVSLRNGEAPTQAEDLLVLGLLVGLLQRIGTADLRVRFTGEADWRQREGRWATGPLPMDAATWDLAWQQPAVRPGAAPMLLAGAAVPEAARAVLAADCAAPWTLPRLAQALGLAPRTLQRRLTEAGTNFSSLWTEVRLTRSARLLVSGRQPAAQVGYLCGFSDQAHFTRSFKRFTAMTPVVYRAQFGGATVITPTRSSPAACSTRRRSRG
jgi:AraC-like DNA-binding protein